MTRGGPRRPPDRAPPKSAPARRGPQAHGARSEKRSAPSLAGEPPPFRRPSADLVALYGYHAVREALRAGRRKPLDLYASPSAAEKLAPEIAASGVRLTLVEPEILSRRLGPGAVHQGALLEARPIAPIDVSEIEARSGLTLVLDQITDPHNVGAILRSAAAFDVDAVLMTERHAPEMTGVLAKAASGALEHVPLAPVVNLARALRELKDLGYLCVGLDSEGVSDLAQTPLRAPVALVLGGEGKGLRRLTRETCEFVARLDMPGQIKSLNVSNACAVALALVSQRLRG